MGGRRRVERSPISPNWREGGNAELSWNPNKSNWIEGKGAELSYPAGTFLPDDRITHVELVAMRIKALKESERRRAPF